MLVHSGLNNKGRKLIQEIQTDPVGETYDFMRDVLGHIIALELARTVADYLCIQRSLNQSIMTAMNSFYRWPCVL